MAASSRWKTFHESSRYKIHIDRIKVICHQGSLFLYGREDHLCHEAKDSHTSLTWLPTSSSPSDISPVKEKRDRAVRTTAFVCSNSFGDFTGPCQRRLGGQPPGWETQRGRLIETDRCGNAEGSHTAPGPWRGCPFTEKEDIHPTSEDRGSRWSTKGGKPWQQSESGYVTEGRESDTPALVEGNLLSAQCMATFLCPPEPFLWNEI